MTEKERAEKYGVLLYEKANLEKRLAQAKRDASSLATDLRRVCDALEGKRTWARAPNGGLLINGSHGVESMSPCRIQSEDKVIEVLAEIVALLSDISGCDTALDDVAPEGCYPKNKVLPAGDDD